MDITEVRNSELFRSLAWMGLLSTEEYRIREVRTAPCDTYMDFDLNNEDIDRVGYLYPHIRIKPELKDIAEFWYEGHYLNPLAMKWIETNHGLYMVVDGEYDELLPVHAIVNPSILKRYTNIADNDETEYIHSEDIKVTDLAFASIENIEHCAYYISQDKVCIPTVEWLDDETLRFSAPYKHDIDFFICSNLVNAVQATANVGVYLDKPHSKHCYHMIYIDNELNYPMDARFYPCVKVDKDCVIRVFSDNSHTILYPEIMRLILYPEFYDIPDPYNSDSEYLNNVPVLDDVIKSSDTDEEIYVKFEQMAKYFYRMWERFPFDTTEQNDFCICGNSSLVHKTFTKEMVYLYDQSIEKIVSNVPVEEFRDLLVYNGYSFSDYTVRSFIRDAEGKLIENSEDGIPYYMIDSSYDPDMFTVIKFNTAEDTNIENIGDYIDRHNIAQLHLKISRFYRNLLTVRMKLLDKDTEDYVRVMTEQPNTKDKYLWFELLINAIPEKFETHTIDVINLFGLDPNNVPEEIKEGAYQIDLDPQEGPTTYTEMLMTYFKLGKAQKDYLVLQYGDGIDDPRIQTFHKIHTGPDEEDPEMNILHIDKGETPQDREAYQYGFKDNDQPSHTEGDLYAQMEYKPKVDNIQIDEIDYGARTPEGTDDELEHTLWIDAPYTPSDLPEKDSLDTILDNIDVVNNPEDIPDPDEGEFAMDQLLDDLTPEEEGSYPIDQLLDSGLDLGLGDIGDVIANNITVDQVDNPEFGMMALDDIAFYNEETGRNITKEEVAALTNEQKLNIVHKYMMDDDQPVDPEIGNMWIQYQSDPGPGLDTIVYKILLTAHVLGLDDPSLGTLAIEGTNLPEDEVSVAYGPHESAIRPHQILIKPLTNEEGEEVPDYDIIHNEVVTYIMSLHEPEGEIELNTLWLGIPAAIKQEIIKDVVSSCLMEIQFDRPQGTYIDDGHDIHATMGFDYIPHDDGSSGIGELFVEKLDPTLRRVYYGDEIFGEDVELQEDDIWYEFLDDIDNRVAYSDENCMVIRVNERLVMLKFHDLDIEAIAFDDIMLNFHGKQGIKYLSIISDLLNSGEISDEDVNIFYKRLITFGDDMKCNLRRIYTGTSHVVTLNKIDTTDFSLLYSTNIGRFRMDYSAPETTDIERSAAYDMCIDYRYRDFGFISSRMLLFVNGRYIPSSDYAEDYAGKIQLLNFNEIISTVDILYSKKDEHLMRLKKLSMQYTQNIDYSMKIERPSRYDIMEPIKVYDQTKKGYYDVLMNEYILNGKLLRILNYLEDHKDEAEEFRNDLVRKFRDVADTGLDGMDEDAARIVIPAMSKTDDVSYQIGDIVE